MLHYKPKIASSVTYPWCFKHELFNREECEKIILQCNRLQKSKGGVLSTLDKKQISKQIRISNVSWVEYNDDSKWFYDKLAKEIDGLNHTFYNYNLTGFHNFQFTEYNSKKMSKYDWHMDMYLGVNPEHLTRKLSATLLLNDGFDGGQFEFYNYDDDQPTMSAGSLIVFPSFMIHRVKVVTKGIRNSLVCWCLGPKFE